MKKAIRDHLRDFLAIAALILVAAGVSVYILGEQRFRFPLIEEAPFRIGAELENAQAVTPGQGQTVEVAGVKIGLIGEVSLRDGRAILQLDIEPRFKDVVREDATALLRPRTGLKDMFVQIDPGSDSAPPAREGFTIPVARTMTDVDLDEILSALDADPRSYVQLLVAAPARASRAVRATWRSCSSASGRPRAICGASTRRSPRSARRSRTRSTGCRT